MIREMATFREQEIGVLEALWRRKERTHGSVWSMSFTTIGVMCEVLLISLDHGQDVSGDRTRQRQGFA